MSVQVFLAPSERGLARAEQGADHVWSVSQLLTNEDIRCLAVDPTDPDRVYAGTQGRGVLASSDAGRTWQPSGLDGAIVKSLAVSRTEPDTLYAGTKPACLFISRDRGTTWTEIDSFRRVPGRWWWRTPSEMPLTAYVQGIALSPTDPDIILVGIEAGAVVRSADGGRTWSGHRKGAVRDCHTLIYHPTDGNWVYEAGGTGAGAAVSRNAGDGWSQPRDGLDRHYGWACAADPAQPDLWYVSASPQPRGLTPPPAHIPGKSDAAIYRKRGDQPWERLAGGLPQPLNDMPYGLITDPQAPGHVYAGLTSGAVWQSTDYGDHWRALPFNLGAIHYRLALLPL